MIFFFTPNSSDYKHKINKQEIIGLKVSKNSEFRDWEFVTVPFGEPLLSFALGSKIIYLRLCLIIKEFKKDERVEAFYHRGTEKLRSS